MCQSPVLAVRLFDRDLGKSVLSFKGVHVDDNLNKLYQKYGRENVFELPCGQCDECRSAYSRNWSYRLTLERLYWNHAYFITLTYDDYHNPFMLCPTLPFSDIPEDLDRIKFIANSFYSDMQKFLKLCRKYLGSIAYFGASELGSKTSRLHYHLILFTNKPIDLIDGCFQRGHMHFHSDFIYKHWKYGDIHDVSPFECGDYCGGYIAKYTTKDKVKCFMSRNIGKRYFYDHYQEIVENGFLIYEKFGHEDKIFVPRFMVPWFKDFCDLDIGDFLKARSKVMNFYRATSMRNICTDIPEFTNSVQNRIHKYSKERGDF